MIQNTLFVVFVYLCFVVALQNMMALKKVRQRLLLRYLEDEILLFYRLSSYRIRYWEEVPRRISRSLVFVFSWYTERLLLIKKVVILTSLVVILLLLGMNFLL